MIEATTPSTLRLLIFSSFVIIVLPRGSTFATALPIIQASTGFPKCRILCSTISRSSAAVGSAIVIYPCRHATMFNSSTSRSFAESALIRHGSNAIPTTR